MGHIAKFTFPVPARKAKPPKESLDTFRPRSKAKRLLGTDDINIDSPTIPKASPFLAWETVPKSGMSISVSDGSTSNTNETDLDHRDFEDDTAGTSYENLRVPWDYESSIIPRQLHTSDGRLEASDLRQQPSQVSLGREENYTADDSSLRRRRSNSSTMHSYYDPYKVPLSISQQTSNSAIAKGLPLKSKSSVDVSSGRLRVPGQRRQRRKPPNLDLSMLIKEHKVAHLKPKPSLGPKYLSKTSSFFSPLPVAAALPSSPPRPRTRQRLPTRIPPGVISPPPTADPGNHRTTTDSARIQRLYDHYGEMAHRHAPSPEEEEFAETPHVVQAPHVEGTPQIESPVTSDISVTRDSEMSFTISMVSSLASLPAQPLSPPRSRGPPVELSSGHSRKDSAATTVTSASQSTIPTQTPSIKDYASSVSSRHTKTSKTSKQTAKSSQLDADLQQQSVLSLSDSDSDSEDEEVSDTDQRSLASSHGQPSIERDLGQQSAYAPQLPVVQEHPSTKQEQQQGQSTRYLNVPSPAGKASSNPVRFSSSTLQSDRSSTSTITPNAFAASAARATGRSSQFSVQSSSTFGSLNLISPGLEQHYSIREAKAIAILPYSSCMEEAESAIAESSQHLAPGQARSRRNSDPPLSPSSMVFRMESVKAPNQPMHSSNPSEISLTGENGKRYVEVTKQEEMLLAALRMKRAKMQGSDVSEDGGAQLQSGRSRSGTIASRDDEQSTPREPTSSMPGKPEEEEDPKLAVKDNRSTLCPIAFPVRGSSLGATLRAPSQQSMRTDSAPRSRILEPVPPSTSHSNLSSKFSTQTRGRNDSQSSLAIRQERVLMYLNNDPVGGLDKSRPTESSIDSYSLDTDAGSSVKNTMKQGLSAPPATPTISLFPRADRPRQKYDKMPAKTRKHANGKASDWELPPIDSGASFLSSVPEINCDDHPDEIASTNLSLSEFSGSRRTEKKAKTSEKRSKEKRSVEKRDAGRGASRPDSRTDSRTSGSQDVHGHVRAKRSRVTLSAVGQEDSEASMNSFWWDDD